MLCGFMFCLEFDPDVDFLQFKMFVMLFSFAHSTKLDIALLHTHTTCIVLHWFGFVAPLSSIYIHCGSKFLKP